VFVGKPESKGGCREEECIGINNVKGLYGMGENKKRNRGKRGRRGVWGEGTVKGGSVTDCWRARGNEEFSRARLGKGGRPNPQKWGKTEFLKKGGGEFLLFSGNYVRDGF